MSMSLKHLCLIVLAATLTVSCASVRLRNEGMKLIENGNYEAGLEKLTEATRADPANLEYRVQLKARHDEAVRKLLGAADRARGAGKLDEADQYYNRVLLVEAGNDRARRGLDATAGDRRHAGMVAQAVAALDARDYDKAESLIRAVLAEDQGFAPANAVQAKIEQAKGPIKITPRLKAHENRPVTLQFRDANTKMVFEVLSRQTGINFVFDKEVKSDGKTTIFVQRVPVEQAVELVLGQNQLARQVLSENMVLIYPNTAAKQKEYQDEIVKTFYLTNTDPKKAQDMLKTVLNVKTLFVDEKSNMLVMRDTPETVRMAEKLIESLDLPESEVMLEVEVLEITRSNLQQLGINYPTSGSISTPTNLTLYNIGRLSQSDFSINPFSVSADLLKQVGVTNTLASPRIRARNREKAKVLIGSRVPVITNSVTPTSGGTAVVTGNVQYLDVGLTLEVEPTVHLDNEVSIKLNLEVSSITKQVTTGTSGTLAYEIGTRNTQTLLSLKDGETQILSGLIQDSDTRNSSHIPGLGDIPIVGRLFGSNRNDKEKSEIVMSITPRVIRSAMRPSSETTEFWYGTESNIRSAPLGSQSGGAAAGPDSAPTNSAPPKEPGAASNAADYLSTLTARMNSAPATTETSAVTLPPANAEAAAAAASVAASTTVVPAATGAAAAPAPEPAAREKTSGASGSDERPTLSWTGATQAKVGQEFSVVLNLSSQQALTQVKAQARFDGRILQLLSADPGAIVPPNLPGSSAPIINQRAGVVQFQVPSTKDSPVKGDGSLVTLRFKALTATPAAGISLQFAAANETGANVPVRLPTAAIIAIEK